LQAKQTTDIQWPEPLDKFVLGIRVGLAAQPTSWFVSMCSVQVSLIRKASHTAAGATYSGTFI
jgi:hypothetical protein